MIKTMYVELDSLFDTRLSFLKIMTDGYEVPEINYHNRERDNFGIIPEVVFKHYYYFRNKRVFKNALPTRVIDLCIDIISTYIRTNESVNKFSLIVNIYPYPLTRIELHNLEEMFKSLFIETEVTFISCDPYELNMEWVSNDVECLIMYDGLKWLEYKNIIGELRKYPITDKILIVPKRIDGIGDGKILSKKDIDFLSVMYKPLVQLEIVDLKTFNARVAETEYTTTG